MDGDTQSLKEKLNKLKAEKIDNPFTQAKNDKLSTKLAVTSGILPPENKTVENAKQQISLNILPLENKPVENSKPIENKIQRVDFEIQKTTVATPVVRAVEPPIVASISSKEIQNETKVNQPVKKNDQIDYDKEIKKRMEAATAQKINLNPSIQQKVEINQLSKSTSSPIAKNPLEENSIEIKTNSQPKVPIESQTNSNLIKSNSDGKTRDLIEKSLIESSTDNEIKIQTKPKVEISYPISDILSEEKPENRHQIRKVNELDTKTTKTNSVPIPPYSSVEKIDSLETQKERINVESMREILTPSEVEPEKISDVAANLAANIEKEPVTGKVRRLYLVNKTEKEEALGSEKFWQNETENPQVTDLKEIRVKAAPEIAEQEGFDQMVNEVYTQLKASSTKPTGQMMNVPPKVSFDKEPVQSPIGPVVQPEAIPLKSQSLFEVDDKNTKTTDSPSQLPIKPEQTKQPTAAHFDNSSKDLFAELNKVSEHPSVQPNNLKQPAEQVKFVEIPREKGMGCPNCRETSTRVVFCPYCGSGMCANCSPNIRPEENYFIYTCPRCGEEINVSKK